jgi:hypothetical protein
MMLPHSEPRESRLDNAQAAAAIAEVLEKHPDLTYYGFSRTHEPNFASDRAEFQHDLARDEFRRSVAWLNRCERVPPTSLRASSSYRLKDFVGGGYVSSGSFTAAAIHLGIEVFKTPGDPNAIIGVAETQKSRKTPPPRG